MATKITPMRLSDETLAKIDRQRGALSRTEYVRRAVAAYQPKRTKTQAVSGTTTQPSHCAHKWVKLGYMTRCSVCGQTR